MCVQRTKNIDKVARAKNLSSFAENTGLRLSVFPLTQTLIRQIFFTHAHIAENIVRNYIIIELMAATPPIPYFTTSRYRVATMVELAKPQPGEKAADLGTGDGRIAIAFAEKGIEVDAYEIDFERIKLAETNIKNAGFTNIKILDKDFWREDLSHYDIVCCYPMPTIMGRLETKLKNELKPRARVLLNYFPFLHWKEKIIKDNIYLYMR